MKKSDNDATYGKMLLTQLKANSKNPSIRTQKNPAWKQLRHSIKNNGMYTPILVAGNNVVIDGNRRLSVARDLGEKYIQCVRLNSTSHKDFDDIFVRCHEDTMAISACQQLERYLKGAKVSKFLETVIGVLEKVGGKRLLKRIVNLNKSPFSYYIGLSMYSKYTGKKDIATMKQVMYWMMNVGSAYKLKSLIGDYIPVKMLHTAVTNRKLIKSHWYINEVAKDV